VYDNLPEYSPTMHLQGYDAYQVYTAFKKSQRKKLDQKRKQKREQSILEKEIFQLMEKSAEAAINAALDDIFKAWK
jgi:hypothetical protein